MVEPTAAQIVKLFGMGLQIQILQSVEKFVHISGCPEQKIRESVDDFARQIHEYISSIIMETADPPGFEPKVTWERHGTEESMAYQFVPIQSDGDRQVP